MLRKEPLVTNHIYHLFNRGVNKGEIFFSDVDYHRFLYSAAHYIANSSKFSHKSVLSDTGAERSKVGLSEPKVQILAYCLMPNHYHFLVNQLIENGITAYMSRLNNSYSHYVNVKYKRVGPLFQGRFKNVLINTDEQLIHTSRYIHLNPLVSGIISKLEDYKWSSYLSYISEDKARGKFGLCDPNPILSHFNSKDDYKKFVQDQEDYGRKLEQIKHLTYDYEG